MLLGRLAINGQEIEASYADVFVVVRDGQPMPGPNDWEVTVKAANGVDLPAGEHLLHLESLDGTTLSGRALLRFSDGNRLLFRGDGHLAGYDD
jgi:hypothetical protein